MIKRAYGYIVQERNWDEKRLLTEIIKNPGTEKQRNIVIEEEFLWNDSIKYKPN